MTKLAAGIVIPSRKLALRRALDLLPRDDINELASKYLPTLMRDPPKMRRADITKRLVWAAEKLGQQQMRHEIGQYLNREIVRGIKTYQKEG